MAEEQSSIQRFLQNRASQILVGSYQRAGSTAQIAVGIPLILIGAGLLVAGTLSHIGGLMLGSIGPFVAGAINLVVGLVARKRAAQAPVEVRLSSEARGFVWNLMRQTNTSWHHHGHTPHHWHHAHHWGQWMGQGAGQNPATSFLTQLGKQWGFVPKTPKDVLPQQLHDLLEVACYHYNRIFGLLESGKTDTGIVKIAATARAGADEALFAILHHAATMHRYPETVSAASRDCEEKIRALKELADGLERIQTRPTSISDRLGYTSAMDSALEEIRLERLAREELSTHAVDEPNLRERL